MQQYEPVKRTLGVVFFSLLFNNVPLLTGDYSSTNLDDLEFTGTITFEYVKDMGGNFATDNAEFYTSEDQEHVLVVDGESLGTRSTDNRAYSYTEDIVEDQDDFETKLRLSFSETETFDVSNTNSIYVFNNGNAAVFTFTSNTGVMADFVSIPSQTGTTINLIDNNTAISYIDITTNNHFSISISSLAVENVTASNAPALELGDEILNFSQGADPAQISPTGTVSLANETMWNGGSLQAQISTNATPGDSLSISDKDGDNLSISVANTDLLANDVVVGSLNMADGEAGGDDLLSLEFNENATSAILQEVLQSIRFEEAYGFLQEELREITITASNSDGVEIKGFKQVQLINYPTFDGCPIGDVICSGFSPTSSANDVVDINGTTQLEFLDFTGGIIPPEGSYFKVQKFNGELLINGQAVVKDQNDSISSTDMATFTPNRGNGQYNIIYGTLFFLIAPDTYLEFDTPARVFASVNTPAVSPTFTHAGNQTVYQNAGATTTFNFITSFDDGDPYGDQEVQFLITANENLDLFSSAPAISSSGVLTYTPNSGAYGKSDLTITMSNEDDETSTQDFTIYITPTGVLINEIHPKASADFEFVEIINLGDATQDISGLVLVLFNGSNDLAYKDIGLEGSINSNDFSVIGGEQVPNLDLDWGSTSFQNGTDAVALYVGSTSDFNTASPPSLDGLVDVIVYGDSDDEGLRAAFGNTNLREPGDDSNSLSRTVDDFNVFVIQPETPGEANLDLGITLSITGLEGVDKVYDGNTAAEVTGTAQLLGIETGDDVYLAGTPEFNFSSPDVAIDIEISVTGYTLEGADIDKYNLSLPTLTGNITVKELTVTGVVGDNKVYDGNLEATVSGTAELIGVETNDEVILGGDPVYTFSSFNAAENIEITSSGYTIAGTDVGNYSVAQPTGLTADITPKALSIIVQANNKIYDGEVSASVSSASLNTDEEVIGDNDVSIGETPSAYAFENSNAGSGKAVTIVEGEFELSGDDASNYTVTQPQELSADIIPRGLTLTVTVNDKFYDGELSTTVDQTILEGLIEGDLVTVSGPTTLDFQDASVGTDKPIITEELFSIEGDATTNYFLDDSQSVGDILPKELSVTGLIGNDKSYDGNTTATASGVATLLGVIEADEVVLGGSPSFTFTSTSVVNGITIISSGFSISGVESGNYIITQPILSADITAKALTVTGITGDDKVYDGTTAASATGTATLSGLESGDEVTLSGSPVFTFTSRNAGSDVSVNVSGYALSGTSAGNYALIQPILLADITAKALSVEVIANNKTYDKTTTATVSSASLVGIENGDVVDLESSPSAFDFASDNVGTGIAISATGNYTITGTDAGNYSVAQPSGLVADITPKALSIIVEANSKIYDGEVSASLGSASLNTDDEVIGGDDVLIGETPSAYAFEDSNAGSDKVVTIVEGEFELSGDDANNYTLDQPDNLIADIIPKALTLTVTANDKVYDGELSATVDQTTLEGLVEGDLVTVSGPTILDFQGAGVGTDISIITEELFSIEGDASTNYFLDDSQSVGDILPKELSVTGLIGNDKSYDGNTTATASGVATLLGVIEADEVVLGGSPSFTFTSTSVANGITIISSGFSISGVESGNYIITQPILSADITAKALTVTGITGDDKVYDGTTAASATGTATLSGLESGDEVTLSGSPVFTFTSRNAGSDVSVNVSGYALSGTSAGNYALIQPILLADITAKALSVEVIANNKTYDKTTTATVSSASLVGIENGDVVDLESSPSAFDFASDNVGTDIAISATGNYTITGTDAGNYKLTQPTLSGDITAKALTITGLTGDDKVYDGTTTATASGTATLSGLEAGDDVSLGGSPVFTIASANAGTNITISTSGYSITGSDAGNYTVTQPTLSANITEPTVAFALTSSSQLESVNTANINVALSSVTAASVTVNYTVTGTATGSGTDYLLADGVLTIDPNSSSNDISIAITDDALDEIDETVLVTLSSPANATLGTNTVHTYTITDNDDAPSVEFGAATDGQTESESAQDLPISISAISGKTITVDYAATGTATGSGTDYTFADGTFTFDPGDQNLTLQLTGIIEDILDEGDETIILTLSNPTNATLGTQQTLTYTITDNDAPPTVSLSVGTNSIVEAAGTTSITATLSAVSGLDVTVNLGYSGTATNGTDYNNMASSSITIPAGQTSTNAAVGLTAIQDTDGEGPETIIVDITSVTNGTEDGIQQQTVTLVDDDDITAPSGYSVTMNDALIGGSETATSTFTFAGAEVGATYNYTMSSDGGGSDVTGTGTISTATDEITIAELSGLGDGTLSLSVTLTDPSGNIGTAATSGASKDATAPNLPVVSSITTDSGSNGADQITNDNTPDVNGTAEANATVEVFVDGVSVGTTSADTGGNWTMAYNGSSPANDGGLAITAKATDAAGNTSAESGTLNVTIDTAAPSAPVISSISTDSGNSGADGITNDNTLNIIGTAEANATVEIIIDGSSIGTTTADGSGDFSFDHTGTTLGDATYSLTAKATDVAGNESAESSVFGITIDTSAPAEPTIGLATSSDSGISDADQLTNNATPTVEGTAEANATVEVFVDGISVGTTIANGSGNWILTPASNLTEGSLIISAKATDASGNEGLDSEPLELTLDLSLTDPTLSPADDAVDILPSSDLTMTFGENMNKGTGNITIKQVGDDSVLETIDVTSAKVTISGGEITINPENQLLPPSTEFYVSIDVGAIKDDAGNDYAGISNNTDWSFTTIAASVVSNVIVPADSTYAIGTSLDFTVNMVLPVTITGTARLPITIGSATVNATQIGTVSNSTSIVFRYTVVEDNLDLDGISLDAPMDLNGGTMRDAFDVDAILTLNNVATLTGVLVDGVRPVPTLSTVGVALTNAAFTTTFSYDKTVSDFDLADITVTNGVASNFTEVTAGSVWSADITPSADGTVSVTLAAGVATDGPGNASAAGNTVSKTFDGTAPTVSTITRKEADQLNTATTTANFRVIFSESVSGVDATDFEIALAGTTGAVNTVTAVDAKTYDVNVNGISGEGTVGINVKDDDSILDDAGNALGGTGIDNGDFTTGQVYATNALPTDITLSGSISENNAIGDVARVLSSVDTDAGDSHTYALVSGTGDTDNGSFSIVGNELKAGVIFDFETKDSYTVRVKTDDGFGGSFEKALTIGIDNVLEPSVFIVQDQTEFDISALGLSQERTITITNDGEIPVEVRAISTPVGFEVIPGALILPVGTSADVTISFVPTEARAYSGNIFFEYSFDEQKVNITHAVTGEGAVITSVDNGSIDAANISIYPNPADRYLTIDLSELSVGKLDIKIVNTAGVKLFGIDEYTDKELRLDVSTYESGIYILQFTNGTSIVRKKVMIKR